MASWRKLDAMTVEVTTKAVDSIFPYQMLWFLISSPAQYEGLGRSWDRFAVPRPFSAAAGRPGRKVLPLAEQT